MIATALAALVTAARLAAPPSPPPTQRSTTPPPLTASFTPGTRLLVLAPHPDDEVLGVAGLMQQVRAAGGRVHVVLMTSGDGFPQGIVRAKGITNPTAADFRSYAALRERETIAALAELGLRRTDVTFLGYPDEGLCHLASTYLFDMTRSFQSPYSQRDQPPETEQLIRGVQYRGVDLRLELERIVQEFAPTLIALPHADDDHPDHCSTHLFAREALAALPARVAKRAHVLHYLIHYAQWPLSADAGTGPVLKPPVGFPPAEGRWSSLALTPAEAAAKKRALLKYKSQLQVIGPFMAAFGRDNELFITGDSATMPACWCDDGANVAVTHARPGTRGRSHH